jgi:hypothetical protein
MIRGVTSSPSLVSQTIGSSQSRVGITDIRSYSTAESVVELERLLQCAGELCSVVDDMVRV